MCMHKLSSAPPKHTPTLMYQLEEIATPIMQVSAMHVPAHLQAPIPMLLCKTLKKMGRII